MFEFFFDQKIAASVRLHLGCRTDRPLHHLQEERGKEPHSSLISGSQCKTPTASCLLLFLLSFDHAVRRPTVSCSHAHRQEQPHSSGHTFHFPPAETTAHWKAPDLILPPPTAITLTSFLPVILTVWTCPPRSASVPSTLPGQPLQALFTCAGLGTVCVSAAAPCGPK